jgi:hypothetical protein
MAVPKKKVTAKPVKETPVMTMRSPEEVEAKLALLYQVVNSVNASTESGELSAETAEEYLNVVQATINIFEWIMGTDVEVSLQDPVLDKVLAMGTVDLRKLLGLKEE